MSLKRRITSSILDIALVVMWLTSAVGHAWLLGDRWETLTLWQIFLTGLGVVLSLALAHWTPKIRSKPMCLLVVALLVCLAHAPGGDLLEPLVQSAPIVLTALGLVALSVREAPLRGFTLPFVSATLPLPRARNAASHLVSFDLFSRPPPRI